MKEHIIMVVTDKDVQKKVVEYFSSFDKHIKDFRIEKVPEEGESREEKYSKKGRHAGLLSGHRHRKSL